MMSLVTNPSPSLCNRSVSARVDVNSPDQNRTVLFSRVNEKRIAILTLNCKHFDRGSNDS